MLQYKFFKLAVIRWETFDNFFKIKLEPLQKIEHNLAAIFVYEIRLLKSGKTM